jgi:hypothetical protein
MILLSTKKIMTNILQNTIKRNIIPIKSVNRLRRNQIFNKNLIQNKNNLKSNDKNKNKNDKMTEFTTNSYMWINIVSNITS